MAGHIHRRLLGARASGVPVNLGSSLKMQIPLSSHLIKAQEACLRIAQRVWEVHWLKARRIAKGKMRLEMYMDRMIRHPPVA
jgi:hypothetical protein